MELFTFALSGLLLGLVWHFMLKKTILDHHRDKLFDLRDELRYTFSSNDWSMEDPIYKLLRDLINGYLRFTENYSFLEFLVLERALQKNAPLREALNKHFEKNFNITDERQKAFVLGFRRQAVDVMMAYMILSSGPLLLVLIVLVPSIGICRIIGALFGLIHAGGRSVAVKAIEVSDLVGSLLRYSVAAVAKRLLKKEFVEEYSYRQSHIDEDGYVIVPG